MKYLKRLFELAGRFFEENRYSGLIIAFVSFVLIILFSLTAVHDLFELKFYDIRFKIKPSIKEWDKLTFVDINENSLANVGQFPWPRDIYAKGIDMMKGLDVSLAGLDIMFPDESPPYANIDAYKRAIEKIGGGARVKRSDIDPIYDDKDIAFAKSVASMKKVVIPYIFSYDELTDSLAKREKQKNFIEAKKRFTERASIKIPEEKKHLFKKLENRSIKTISFPIVNLMNSARSFGFVDRDTDPDGIIRKIRLIRYHDGRVYFNLSMVMLMDICRAEISKVEVNPGSSIILKGAVNPLTEEKGDISIPIDSEGMMYVNWAGPGPRERSFRILPFYALLEYSYFIDGANDFFDSAEKMRNAFKLGEIYSDIEKSKEKYATSTIPAEKLEARKRIDEGRNAIFKLKTEYSKDITAEIARLKAEYKKTSDQSLKKEYEQMEEDFKAVKLVTDLETLAGNYVITGLTAAGTHDIGAIPLNSEYARVGTYHNTINTIINNGFIIKLNPVLNAFFVLILALSMGFLIHRFDARRALAVIFASAALVNIIVVVVFSAANIWADQLSLNLAVMLPSITIASVKFINEESQKRFIKGAFSRYLSPDVIDRIIENPKLLELGGESREITIFFSDVAGFSSISEGLSPKELVALLNEYLSEMTDIILSHGGTIDKYEGDAVIAFFGAPLPFEDHALRCCLAAIDQKIRLRELQKKWKKEGKHELFVRMGINTGNAVVGNMGSLTRMNYTMMGDSVNLASRLEGANKFYDTKAMIGEGTYLAVKDQVDTRLLDTIRVIGKKEAVKIYELFGRKGTLKDNMKDMLEHYYKGLEYFKAHHWKKAINSFNDGLKIIKDDGPSLTYVKRCEEFMKKPPSKNWDGVYSLKSK